MDSNNISFSAVLSSLQAFENNSGYDVYVPSQKTDKRFKVLTTEQLKELLKTVIDTPIYNTQFVLTFNKIIKNNCFESGISETLTAYDKLFVFLKTRIENISNEYSVTFTEDELKQHKLDSNIKGTILITDVYTKLVNSNKEFLQETFNQDQCGVTCTIPTLETENKLEQEFHKTTKINVDTPEELREIVGNTFINEITKYITSIQIGEQTLDFTSLTFKNRIKIVEKLPANLIKNVLKYIETYKQFVADILKVEVVVQNKEQKQVIIEKELPFDASFFNA